MTPDPAGGRSAPGPRFVRGPDLAAPARAVYVAPHPSDAVFGAAGLLGWFRRHGTEVVVVAVTDGEASHKSSRRIQPGEVAERRARERERAFAILGFEDVPVLRHGIPDGFVGDHAEQLTGALADLLGRDTVVVVPWRRDGHPDHEAVHHAGRRAASVRHAALWQVPIVARVTGTFVPDEHTAVLDLGPDWTSRKRHAAAAFRSQLVAVGPDPEDGPVVRDQELARLTTGEEWIVPPTEITDLSVT